MRFHKGRDVFECVSRVVGRTVLTFGNRRSATAARRATFNSKLFTLNSSGFTLIELLIVTVVIVTLMGIVFRLAGVGGTQSATARTQARLQRLENAISGYYAAYGSYPPVPLEGRSRDINTPVDKNGVQGDVTKYGYNKVDLSKPDDEDTRKQVEAACRAQPVAVLFPPFMSSVDGERKSKYSVLVGKLSENSGAGQALRPLNNTGGLHLGEKEEATLFQFGLLSFLLPRYLFMITGDEEMHDTRHSMWDKNNQLPCRIDTGRPFESWKSIQKALYSKNRTRQEQIDFFVISNHTSQAVCARWMPNLKGIIVGGQTFYGVDTADEHPHWKYLLGKKYDADPKDADKKWLRAFSRNGYNQGCDYMLDGMTVADGWAHEFYYYSDTPYQSYTLWSAGANGRTFPPWLMEHLNSYSSTEQETITGWTKDDISHMAN